MVTKHEDEVVYNFRAIHLVRGARRKFILMIMREDHPNYEYGFVEQSGTDNANVVHSNQAPSYKLFSGESFDEYVQFLLDEGGWRARGKWDWDQDLDLTELLAKIYKLGKSMRLTGKFVARAKAVIGLMNKEAEGVSTLSGNVWEATGIEMPGIELDLDAVLEMTDAWDKAIAKQQLDEQGEKRPEQPDVESTNKFEKLPDSFGSW